MSTVREQPKHSHIVLNWLHCAKTYLLASQHCGDSRNQDEVQALKHYAQLLYFWFTLILSTAHQFGVEVRTVT